MNTLSPEPGSPPSLSPCKWNWPRAKFYLRGQIGEGKMARIFGPLLKPVNWPKFLTNLQKKNGCVFLCVWPCLTTTLMFFLPQRNDWSIFFLQLLEKCRKVLSIFHSSVWISSYLSPKPSRLSQDFEWVFQESNLETILSRQANRSKVVKTMEGVDGGFCCLGKV